MIHKYMYIFKEHKDSLPPYSKEELTFTCVTIINLSVDVSPGSNHIVRKSSESAVTVPDVPSFDTLFKKTEAALGGPDSGLTEFESATGIPNRFLLPKGNEQGLEFDLVVPVTDDNADAAVERLHENTEFNHYGAHASLGIILTANIVPKSIKA
ncbi:hemocyanin subunit-like [Penaeus indicus]|uniref:hemocyanin subunit-like n=1 Tax=Penaeus indicus TaxID=29960 RepID=UPI00300C260E